jgi:hypothetical protein
MPNILTRLRIDEVSSVDRGAGEGVKILLMKRDKDKPMTKIGSMFSNFFSGGNNNNVTIDKAIEGLAESVGSIVSEASNPNELTASLTKTFEQFGDHLKSTLTAPAVVEKKGSDMDMKALAKALGLPETATEADINAAVVKNVATTMALATSVKKMETDLAIAKADFTPAELDFYKAFNDNDGDEGDDPKQKAKKAFRLAGHAERSTIMKSAEPALSPDIQRMKDENDALKKRVEMLEGFGDLLSLTKEVTAAGLPESEALTLQKARKGDPDAVMKILGFVKSAHMAAVAGGVFKEFGSSNGTGAVTTAYDELSALAKNLVKIDPKLTFPAAFAKVYEDPANIEIVKRERGENRPTVN